MKLASHKAALVGATALVFPTPAIIHNAAYANSITALLPDLYAALDVVSRELVGFIPSVGRAPGVERAMVGQTVTYDTTGGAAAVDITPAMVVPTPADQTLTAGSMTISKARAVAFGITGEEQRGLNTGIGYLSRQARNFAQALRTLVNEIEADLGACVKGAASRAHGTAGTTPFASNLGDTAQLRKILDDNGAPASGRSCVIDTTAGAALRTLAQLTKANEAGSVMTLRDGALLDLHGFAVKESAGVYNHTKGTGASATTNASGYSVGDTVITLASAGTGTIVQGDVITFAGDTNKYVVASGDADVSGGGTITLTAPGLRKAIAASATAITVVGSAVHNVGFSEDAIHLVTRLPAVPQEGDAAIDRFVLTDPRSGLSFEVAIYAGYRMIRAEVAAVWGVKAVKSEHIALLLG
jgi:hypothetical protein